jgi:Ni/Fe-hydrogenase 1 B-type cytochrome subunit
MSAAADTARAVAEPPPEARIPVRVWDLCVRLTHWGMALSLFVLAATGYYIGRPFVSVPGPAGEHFVMGTTKAVHLWAAIVFTVSVVARLFWMFLGGRYARWRQFVPVSRARRRGLVQVVRFYSFLRADWPDPAGHNPLAGVAYIGVFALCLTSIATGLALWGASASPDSVLHAFAAIATWLGGLQTTRWIHHAVMWLLLGFFVHHIITAIFMTRVEDNGLIASIFSGTKFLTREQLERERRGDDA